MQVFELKINPAGGYNKRQLNLTLSQGDVQLESRQVKLDMGDLLFSEVTGLRGICRMIEKGKNPSNALKECGIYLYEKFLGKSIGKRLLTGEKTLLRIMEDKADKKTVLIPWESLRDGENYLIKKDLVVTRSPCEIFQPPPSPMRVSGALRVLVLASQPRDRENLAINKEIDTLLSVFDAFNIGMRIQVDVLTYGCTRERLMDLLENRPPYHILHFIGAAAKNKLIIEDHDGTSDPFYGDELVELFSAIDQPPYLMVLATPSQQNSFWKNRRLNPTERDTREGTRFDRSVGISYDLIQSGVTSAVVGFRLETDPHQLNIFQREFYYQLIQQNHSIGKSFHSAQVMAIDQRLDQWFFPALYGGDALNRPLLLETTKETKKDKKIRLTDMVDISSPADFVGRYQELRKIAKRLIYGNAHSLCILGEEGVGKTTLAARAFDVWKSEYDGVFAYSFFPGCTLDEFWLDFRLFAVCNRLVVNLSPADLEGRTETERYKIIEERILSVFSSGRYLMVLDNFQNLLGPEDSDLIFKQGGFEELFKSLFSSEKHVETLICSSSFPQSLSAEPWNVSVLPLEGIEFNDMPVFCEQSPKMSEFLGKLDADGRSQFYQVFGGNPTLLKFFELWKAKKGWYEAIKSGGEPDKESGNLSSFSLLYEKVPPEVKKLLSLLQRMNREIILGPLISAFDVKKEEKIEGFSRARKMGFLRIVKGRVGVSTDRVEVASIIGAYYSENSQDLDIFKREHQYHLKQYGKSAVELGRQWIEEEEKERGFALMLSAWDCLFAAGEFSDASALLQEICGPLLDMCLFQTCRCMYGALIEVIQDDREKIVLLRQMGKILASEGMDDEMEANYQQCLEINRSQADRAEVAGDLYELGAIQLRRGFYDKGLEYLEESLKIRTDMDLEGGKADSLEKIAAIYAAKKEYSKTVDLYSQALKIRSTCKDYPGVSGVLGHLSEVYHKLGDYARSMETDTRKVEVDKKCNNPDGMVRTLLHMTDLQIEMERYEEGISLLEKCMTLEKQLGDQIGIAGALLKKSEIKRRQGRLDEAMLYCRQSLQANEQLDHRLGLAANYSQLSFIYHDQREPEEAIKYAAKSLDLFNDISDKENMVSAALHLGDIYQGMSDFDSALTYYRQALEIKRDEEEMGAMAAIQNLIANLHYLKGETGLALKSYGESLSILKHLNRVPKIAEALHHMATIHQEQGNLSEATGLYQQSLDLNKELENLNGIALSLGQIGRILEQEGKHCKAVGKFAASLAIFRHLKSEYEELATQDLTNLKNQLPDVEYKWCVTAGLEEHAPYLVNVEVEGKDF